MALLLFTGCAAPRGTGTTVGATNTPPVHLLALGDSYTSGERVQEAERWTLQLVDRLRAVGTPVEEPTLIAQSGWTTAQLEERLSTVRLRVPFDLVTLLIGTNNQFQGRDTAEYRADIRNLVGQAIGYAGGRPGRLLVLSLPDWGATPFGTGRDRAAITRGIDAFNAINRQEAAAAGALYLDITPESRHMLTDRDLVSADGLHPSGRLYGRWAEAALPLVRAALADTSAAPGAPAPPVPARQAPADSAAAGSGPPGRR